MSLVTITYDLWSMLLCVARGPNIGCQGNYTKSKSFVTERSQNAKINFSLSLSCELRFGTSAFWF